MHTTSAINRTSGAREGYCTRTKDKTVKRSNKRGFKHVRKQELRDAFIEKYAAEVKQSNADYYVSLLRELQYLDAEREKALHNIAMENRRLDGKNPETIAAEKWFSGWEYYLSEINEKADHIRETIDEMEKRHPYLNPY